jgi:hypothetical protein
MKCPHCEEAIDIVGAQDLREQYGINSNALQHARDTGNFPEPFLSFQNRNLWLRVDIEEHVAMKGRTRIVEIVEELETQLQQLPEADREELLRRFANRNANPS